jgi:hypothetical protein
VTARISLQSPQGRVRFEDSLDHFENGVLRLLGLTPKGFELWLAMAEREDGDSTLDRLGRAYRRLSPLGYTDTLHSGEIESGPCGVAGALWHTCIADDRSCGIAKSEDGGLAWLVEPYADGWRRITEAPEYERPSECGEPEDTLDRARRSGVSWRTERARRRVLELLQVLAAARCRVLEVGLVGTHFRDAARDAGLEHESIHREAIDRIDAELCRRQGRFDAVTMYDFLPRVAEPRQLLGAAMGCLRPGGVLVVKTPNIRCPEARLFGPHYHAFRRERLVYFTVASLRECALAVGLTPVRMTTVSHLLVGFIGRGVADHLAADKQGSDIVAYFRAT